MNNNIDMTRKEHLLELWSERKNMQQVIHELIQNSETGVVAYDRFYKELETRYNTSFPKNNEDMILKGILDNVSADGRVLNVSGGTAVMKDREGYMGVPKAWIQGWGQGLALAFFTAVLKNA